MTINLGKNPVHLLGESADSLRESLIAYDYPSSASISGMLYRGDYANAYARCVERYGATHPFSKWCYDLVMQWELITGRGE